MKKRIIRLLLLTSTMLIMLTACEYEFITPVPPAPKPPANDTISYSQDIQPFFNAKCVSCHAGSIKPNLSSGLSYDEVVPGYVNAGEPETSELYLVCKPAGSMTAYATITPAELDLLYRWIYAGAKND